MRCEKSLGHFVTRVSQRISREMLLIHQQSVEDIEKLGGCAGWLPAVEAKQRAERKQEGYSFGDPQKFIGAQTSEEADVSSQRPLCRGWCRKRSLDHG